MGYDKGCSVYWCDECSRYMDVDYDRSNKYGVVLKCTKPDCGFSLFFVATNEQTFEEVTHVLDVVDANSSVSTGDDGGSLAELDDGILDRTSDAPTLLAPEVEEDDDEVRGC